MEIGLLIAIPSLIRSCGYQSYISYKEKNCKEFFEKLNKSENKKEEREIYIIACSKIES